MARRLHLAGTLCLALLSAEAGSAAAGEITLRGAETRLPPGQLGGVTRIFRYAVARPDRGETDYLLPNLTRC